MTGSAREKVDAYLTHTARKIVRTLPVRLGVRKTMSWESVKAQMYADWDVASAAITRISQSTSYCDCKSVERMRTGCYRVLALVQVRNR
ncbi:hypothetical protein BV25DRAFT_1818655 [Artomyces pyxidatus]|uniref:Uncharacterized protein n=1 Tax=Artomyces pyxidatus TaxID=48021 RepID=A0ACB8TIH2_9AGAM|nr:hypothetical protein BV25DRAFT_1818655 [Artomyces pyxidatus]